MEEEYDDDNCSSRCFPPDYFAFCFNRAEESKPIQTSASSPTPLSSLLLPPSYSLALGLELQVEEEAEEGFGKRFHQSDILSDSASTSCPAASRAQELTASELLRSR